MRMIGALTGELDVELIDLAVFSAKNRKCFCLFYEGSPVGLLPFCSFLRLVSQYQFALLKRSRNVAFGG